MDAALQRLPSPDSTKGDYILLFVQISLINSSNHESHHYWEDPRDRARLAAIVSSQKYILGTAEAVMMMMMMC